MFALNEKKNEREGGWNVSSQWYLVLTDTVTIIKMNVRFNFRSKMDNYLILQSSRITSEKERSICIVLVCSIRKKHFFPLVSHIYWSKFIVVAFCFATPFLMIYCRPIFRLRSCSKNTKESHEKKQLLMENISGSFTSTITINWNKDDGTNQC